MPGVRLPFVLEQEGWHAQVRLGEAHQKTASICVFVSRGSLLVQCPYASVRVIVSKGNVFFWWSEEMEIRELSDADELLWSSGGVHTPSLSKGRITRLRI